MKIKTIFECRHADIKKVKNYGILMPRECIGQVWCCIPITEGMSLTISDHVGEIEGTYELLYREVLPRQEVGVIRLPKEYMSCDVMLIR